MLSSDASIAETVESSCYGSHNTISSTPLVSNFYFQSINMFAHWRSSISRAVTRKHEERVAASMQARQDKFKKKENKFEAAKVKFNADQKKKATELASIRKKLGLPGHAGGYASADNATTKNPSKGDVSVDDAHFKVPSKGNVSVDDAHVKVPSKGDASADYAHVKVPSKGDVSVDDARVKVPSKGDASADDAHVKVLSKGGASSDDAAAKDPSKFDVTVDDAIEAELPRDYGAATPQSIQSSVGSVLLIYTPSNASEGDDASVKKVLAIQIVESEEEGLEVVPLDPSAFVIGNQYDAARGTPDGMEHEPPRNPT